MKSLRALGLSLACLCALVAAHQVPVTRAQDQAQPGLDMAALQLPTGVRYTVTLENPTQATLDDLQVSVQLPADAVFVDALETPGFTQFQGNQAGTLTWNAASFAPTDVIDAFAFLLQQPSSGTFAVSASWDGDGAGQLQSQFQPAVPQAVDSAADLTFTAATLAQGAAPVGNTGVIIAAVSGQLPAGTTLHVRVLSPDNNPPAATGDLWWCAEVEVDGLPAGTGLLLQVPTRQPLPPEAAVSLFNQDASGTWQALPDQAQVSADGQSILYVHHGGVVAAGTGSANQPRLVSSLVVSPTIGSNPVVRQITATKIAQDLGEQALVPLMVQAAHCPPGDCAGLPPCTNSQLVAGGTCANGSIRAQGDSAAVTGRTFCNPGGAQCVGTVGLLPGGGAAPAGHGTRCSFTGFTQTAPPGLTCNTF